MTGEMLLPRSFYGRRQVEGKWKEGQCMITDVADALQLVMDSNNRCMVFMSHNSYPPNEEGIVYPIAEVDRVRIEKQFVDLDNLRKPENAHLDLIKLVVDAEKERWPWEASFSGKKGFHFFLKHWPAIYPLDVTVSSNESIELRAYYTAAQGWFKKRLGLRSVDLNCAEPKRVHRVWNTVHMNKDGARSGYHCIPLTIEQVLDWSFEEILDIAKEPQPVTEDYWNQDKDWYTFSEWLTEYHIHPHMSITDGVADGMILLSDYEQSEDDKVSWEWFKRMMPDMCIHNAMFNSRNPSHLARFASAVTWRGGGVDMAWVEKFYHTMQYVDVGNRQQRVANLKSIWNRGPGSSRPHLPLYRYPTCEKLYKGGICVGPSCPKFSRYLQSISKEVERDSEGKWVIDNEEVE